MSVIIGAGTQVYFGGYCVISANWGLNPNSQRLYCIGSWVPYMTIDRPTQTLNLTIYSPGPTYDTAPTQSCSDANTIAASVSPAACGAPVEGVSGDWFVTSYSFSKEDASMPGQESWSLIKYVLGNPSTDPTYVLRGIAEGTATPNAGVEFDTISTSVTTGSVSAGGYGRADELNAGTVIRVGGGSSAAGETGQGSVSIPYNPLYI